MSGRSMTKVRSVGAPPLMVILRSIGGGDDVQAEIILVLAEETDAPGSGNATDVVRHEFLEGPPL